MLSGMTGSMTRTGAKGCHNAPRMAKRIISNLLFPVHRSRPAGRWFNLKGLRLCLAPVRRAIVVAVLPRIAAVMARIDQDSLNFVNSALDATCCELTTDIY
jgi:hypothetical protein